ncbi:MAG TPA: transglycosylase SLT domain-containing protein [Chitinophagales bacterium]|nr:transglycosylase SLT domain-containing protein [Chitinophagales bacterium]
MKSSATPPPSAERTVTINLHTLVLIVLAVLLSNVANYLFAGKNKHTEFEFHDNGLPQKGLYMIDLARPYVADVYAFEKEVRRVSDKLTIPPEWLMSVMYSESKFDASISNHRGSGAVGLIQWMPATAKDFGTSVSALKQMTHVEQLTYVQKYLDRVQKKYRDFESLTDLYLAILYPKALEGDFCYALYASPSVNYKMNSGLDENKDGVVTVKDIDSRMKRIYPTAYMISKDGKPAYETKETLAGF